MLLYSLRISLCRQGEYDEVVGNEKVPLIIASDCSPNGVSKKHNLYNKQPNACSMRKYKFDNSLTNEKFIITKSWLHVYLNI